MSSPMRKRGIDSDGDIKSMATGKEKSQSPLKSMFPLSGPGALGGSFAAGASGMSGMGQGLVGILGLSPDRKSGLSMMNPSLMKMNRGTGSKFGVKSQTSRSQGTRRTGTMSRKSR
mmetsp:Transcript_6322/g.10291  ORF Transcript_6322/g.10291 Transcript_6322/m.10291 type:complete len:116 (+) Transcript_6322:341-688(+)